MIHRTLIIHKAKEVDEVSINITDLPEPEGREVYNQEGKGIAEALWQSLPSRTVDAIINTLNSLQNNWEAEVIERLKIN